MAWSSAWINGLESSTYQSQTLFQTNTYSAFAASLNLYCSRELSTASRTKAVSPIIHLFNVCLTDLGSNLLFGDASLNSANRVAFHNFVPKLRYPSILLSESFKSRPIAAIAVKVKRTASAPYLSIKSRGSITFPVDLDIFLPCSSRTNG